MEQYNPDLGMGGNEEGSEGEIVRRGTVPSREMMNMMQNEYDQDDILFSGMEEEDKEEDNNSENNQLLHELFTKVSELESVINNNFMERLRSMGNVVTQIWSVVNKDEDDEPLSSRMRPHTTKQAPVKEIIENESCKKIQESLQKLLDEGMEVNWPENLTWLEEQHIRKIFAALDHKIKTVHEETLRTEKVMIKMAWKGAIAGSFSAFVCFAVGTLLFYCFR